MTLFATHGRGAGSAGQATGRRLAHNAQPCTRLRCAGAQSVHRL